MSNCESQRPRSLPSVGLTCPPSLQGRVECVSMRLSAVAFSHRPSVGRSTKGWCKIYGFMDAFSKPLLANLKSIRVAGLHGIGLQRSHIWRASIPRTGARQPRACRPLTRTPSWA